jgi:hypothetical protein
MALPSRGRLALWGVGFCLAPLAFGLRALAFQYPQETERIYGEWLYPRIALVIGGINSLVPFSLAEMTLGVLLILGFGYLVLRRRRRRSSSSCIASLVGAVTAMWVLAGAAALSFLLLWGFNYARPDLETRLQLSVEHIEKEEVIEAGRHCAVLATKLHGSLAQPSGPTRLPLDFSSLNRLTDRRLQELELPGDRVRYPTSPAKKLWLSSPLSYLGISGIFIAFTGEPSVNALLPDAVVPMVVAHEKAHQRGITNEGEANLAAFLACAGASGTPYLPYTAYLYAAAQLLQTASVRWPDAASDGWSALGTGPRQDLDAIHDFWQRYHGPAAEAAEKVNDAYLRSFRVPEGVQSYQRVVELLVALDRQGKLGGGS